jgi:hypothetical protein
MPASLFPDQRTVVCVRLRTIAANKPGAAIHDLATQRFAIQSSCQGEARANRLRRNDYRRSGAHSTDDLCTAKPQPAAIVGMTKTGAAQRR